MFTVMSVENPAPMFQVPVHPATSLLREVIEQSADYSRMVGEQLQVNQTDFEAMEHLIAHGPMSAGDLAKAVGISPGSATVMIDRLVALGHVSREPNPNDRRGVLVAPNPESVAQAWKHISPLIAASEKALADLSLAERTAIEAYLRTMLQVYSQTQERPANS
jgi:DNA-binding MarR family transcriptional regulator